MNHLAHFLLSPDDDEARAGTLIADYARGTDLSRFSPRIEFGIRLHRWIDAVVDTSPEVTGLKPLVDAPLRRYAGILFDVFFDYALIRTWNSAQRGPLPLFTASVYASLSRIQAHMPPPAATAAERMQTYDALMSCATHSGCARTLARIATRLKRPVNLAAGIAVLERHEATIVEAFERFLPVLQQSATGFAAGQLAEPEPRHPQHFRPA